MQIRSEINEDSKQTLKALMDSETGALLNMLADLYERKVKEQVYRGTHDPEKIRRIRQKGWGVREFIDQLQEAAGEVKGHADTDA
jgi:uncharacterized protein YqeY